jgi:hypothetical protein
MTMDPVERIEVLLVWTGVSQEANASDPAELLRARREWPRRGGATEKRDELAPSHAEHGGSSTALHCRRSVYRTLNLPQTGRQVLGVDLLVLNLGEAMPTPPCAAGQNGSTTHGHRETAALRDFDPANDRFGSCHVSGRFESGLPASSE